MRFCGFGGHDHGKTRVFAAFSPPIFPQLAVTSAAGNDETNGLLQRLLGVDSDQQAQRFARLWLFGWTF